MLRGGTGYGDSTGEGGVEGSSFIFDVVPFCSASCYYGYDDGDNGFFRVYAKVFQDIMEGEKSSWVSEGNIDETKMPNAHLLSAEFGSSTSDWAIVLSFYNVWESFTSCLSFAWADKYDPRDAPNRKVRRAIDDENRKARKAAKRERNNDVLNLVRFVKRRDPRVKVARDRIEQESAEKEADKKKESERRKAEAMFARKAWKEEAEKAMLEADADNLQYGRFRLADLDDDEIAFFGSKKGRKKKKSKKGKNMQSPPDMSCSDNDHHSEANGNEPIKNVDQQGIESVSVASDYAENDAIARTAKNGDNTSLSSSEKILSDDISEVNDGSTQFFHEEDQSEGESELYTWSCECCAKDFKNEGQMKNHKNTIEHKEEYDRKIKKVAKEQALAEELLEEKEDEEDDTSESSTEKLLRSQTNEGTEKDLPEEESESDSEEESEPDIWRCECCRKDFKSEGQMQNHIKSKKHKGALKKYEEKIRMEVKEQALMEEMLEEMVVESDS